MILGGRPHSVESGPTHLHCTPISCLDGGAVRWEVAEAFVLSVVRCTARLFTLPLHCYIVTFIYAHTRWVYAHHCWLVHARRALLRALPTHHIHARDGSLTRARHALPGLHARTPRGWDTPRLRLRTLRVARCCALRLRAHVHALRALPRRVVAFTPRLRFTHAPLRTGRTDGYARLHAHPLLPQFNIINSSSVGYVTPHFIQVLLCTFVPTHTLRYTHTRYTLHAQLVRATPRRLRLPRPTRLLRFARLRTTRVAGSRARFTLPLRLPRACAHTLQLRASHVAEYSVGSYFTHAHVYVAPCTLLVHVMHAFLLFLYGDVLGGRYTFYFGVTDPTHLHFTPHLNLLPSGMWQADMIRL